MLAVWPYEIMDLESHFYGATDHKVTENLIMEGSSPHQLNRSFLKENHQIISYFLICYQKHLALLVKSFCLKKFNLNQVKPLYLSSLCYR